MICNMTTRKVELIQEMQNFAKLEEGQRKVLAHGILMHSATTIAPKL